MIQVNPTWALPIHPHLSNFTTKTERVPIRALPMVRRGRRCAVVGLPLYPLALEWSRQRVRMSGLPGSRRPVSGTSPRVPHTLTTVHPVTPPLLQRALPPAGVQLQHRSHLETVRVPRAIADSA